MKQDIQRIMLAAAKPLFLIFILYMLKIVEVGPLLNQSVFLIVLH